MDAITLLRDDHRSVAQLFKQFEPRATMLTSASVESSTGSWRRIVDARRH